MLKKEETAFVFPGQGSQVVQMGFDFYNNFQIAKEVFEEVDDYMNFKLSKIIFEGSEEELRKTENTQSALMATSMAIIKCLEQEVGRKAFDIVNTMAGHSLGEYSALCASESITLKEATILLKNRGLFMANVMPQGGAMLALIGMEEVKILELIEKAKEQEVLVIANDNSVGQVVLSGNDSAIQRAQLLAKEYGAKMAIKLEVSGPFHSPLLHQASLQMKDVLEKINFQKPKCKVLCNVNATYYTNELEIKDLLEKQIISSVKWKDTMLNMEQDGIKNVFEIGAGKVLCGLFKRTAKGINPINISSVEDLKNNLHFFL